MIGIGTPSSQSKIPRPMEFSFHENQGLLFSPNSGEREKFLRRQMWGVPMTHAPGSIAADGTQSPLANSGRTPPALGHRPNVSFLVHGPLGASAVHLCVDMQRLFADGSPWATPV